MMLLRKFNRKTVHLVAIIAYSVWVFWFGCLWGIVLWKCENQGNTLLSDFCCYGSIHYLGTSNAKETNRISGGISGIWTCDPYTATAVSLLPYISQ
jgi:hypothetical protein